jgi:pimeloyl-ACP methyl ester carboxylesterase
MRVHGASRSAYVALLILSALVVTGCTLGPSQRPALATLGSQPTSPVGTSTSGPPLGQGGPGQQADPVRWERCDDVDAFDRPSGITFEVDCAEIQVDRSAATTFGDQSIQVARARAPGVPADAPPVVVLLGAPGENGRSEVAAVAAGLSAAVRDNYAVITVDLAGVGRSDPIDCLSRQDTGALASLGVDPTEPAAAAALADLSRSLTFACGDAAGPELSSANSTIAADDLDALRDALGQQTLTIIGRGFGATLAAVYVDRYPGRVAAAVLDAPGDPLQDPVARAAAVAAATERALDTFAASCADFTGGCPLGADPRGEVERIVALVDDTSAGDPGDGQTNGGTVLLTLLLRLGDPAGWPELAGALASAGEGDTTALEEDLMRAMGTGESDWVGGAILYGCNDTAVRISPEQLSAAVTEVRPRAPLFGPYTVGLNGICSSWPAPEDALGAVTGTGAAPILLVGAVDDPLSPHDAVRSLAGQLGSATLLSWQSGRHGSYPASPCVTAAVDAYLLSGQLPGVGSLCPP